MQRYRVRVITLTGRAGSLYSITHARAAHGFNASKKDQTLMGALLERVECDGRVTECDAWGEVSTLRTMTAE